MRVKSPIIIQAMARNLLKDYGHEAYENFCQKNPKARWQEYEDFSARRAAAEQSLSNLQQAIFELLIDRTLEILTEYSIVPQLCGPMGRVMP